MTETTCAAIHVPGGADDDSGSIGYLDPNTEGKLIDDEGKEVTKAGTPGELFVRGPQMCLGYWRNEAATQETLEDGWLKTGDVAQVDEKGWFWIVDRKKELIKVNGLQVAPAELEAVLLEHPDIADAAVVGITIRDEEFPRGCELRLLSLSLVLTIAQMWCCKKRRREKYGRRRFKIG